MLQISNLTDSARQQTTVLLADNTSAVLTLVFLPSILRWSLDIEYGGFAARGLSLSIHPNILRSYRRELPFGLAVVAPDGADPFDINDFSTGRVSLYILDNTEGETEVADVESEYFGGLP